MTEPSIRRSRRECFGRLAVLYAAIGAFSLLALGGLIGGSLFGDQDSTMTLALVGLLAALAVIPVAHSLAAGRFEILDLGTWFSFYMLLTYGLRALFDIGIGSPILAATPGIELPSAINVALTASVCGLLMFRLAYASPIGARFGQIIPRLPARWDGTRLVFASAALLGSGWMARAAYIFVAAGGPATWLQMDKFVFLGGVKGVSYLERIGEFALLGLFALLAAARVTGRRWLWWLFGVALLPEIAYALFSGTRKQLLAIGLGIAVLTILTRPRGHRASVRAMRVFVLLALLGGIAYPVLTRMRAGDYRPIDLLNVFPNLVENPREAIRVFMSRQFSLDSLVLIMHGTAAGEPFTYGKELGLVGAAWIPRAVWPDKPIISIGKILYDTMFPQIFQPGTAVAVGVCGHLYWALGWAGIVFGMGLLGIAWRLFDTCLVRPRANLSCALVLSVMFWSFFFFAEQHFVRLFSDELLRLVGALVAVAVIGDGGFWRSRSRNPAGLPLGEPAAILHGGG